MQGNPEGSYAFDSTNELDAERDALEDEAKHITLRGLERAARRLQEVPDSGFWLDALAFWTRCAQEDFGLDKTEILR